MLTIIIFAMFIKICVGALGLAQANATPESFMKHPNVQASGQVVEIEIENNNDYYGPMFIG